MTPEEIRNQTIDELCDWLESCIEHVDHDTEVYKACASMVGAMRGKKTVVTHYPLSHKS
jgi:hypothetical protein